MRADSDKAIALIYSALLGETGWQDVVDTVAVATGSDIATLFYHDSGSGRGAINLGSGITEAVQRDYLGHFASLNPWMRQVEATPIGKGIVGEQIVARDHFLRSEYYNDFLRRHDQESGVGVTVRRDDDCFLLFSVLSGDADFDRNSERAAYLTRIAPHLRRASEFYRRQPLDTLGGGFADSLGKVGNIATVVVNTAARVIYASALGETRLAAGSPLGVDAAGGVSFHDPLTQSVFSHALRGGHQNLMTRSLAAGDTEVTFVCMAQDHGSSIFMGGTVAILMAPRGPNPMSSAARMAARHGLTGAEQRVLEGIVAGQRPADIAAAAGVTMETVRSQLKAIYGKTGVNRQAALVRLAMGLTEEDGGQAASRRG